jgi:hypothetical protein
MTDTVPETALPSNLDTLVEELYGPRPAWRAAVATIAEKAKATLPECNGRVEKAVALVLAGDVAFHADGSATVGSASDASTAYHIVQGHCDCTDFARAPHGYCKHRLSAAIARRARELTAATAGGVAPPTPSTAPLPEAPASINVHITLAGRDCQLTLRDTDETRLLTRLETVLARFPVAAPALVQTPTMGQAPVCQWHGAMKPSTKGKGFFCPAKMADGTYCQERA